MSVQAPPPLINAAPLSRVSGLSPTHIAALKPYWLNSVQDLLACVEVPGGRDLVRSLLQMTDDQLDALLARARSMVSLRGAKSALEQEAMGATYQTGALEPPPTERAESKYVRLPVAPTLPPVVNFADHLPPPRDQGGRGTCVAHAAAAVREQLEIAAGLAAPSELDLSEQLIYWWCKQQDKLPTVSGTFPHLGMDCLAELGTASEQVWPYNSRPRLGDEDQGPPPPAALANAWRYRVKRVLTLDPQDIGGIKAALAADKAVMVSIPIYLSWYQNRVTRRYGKINMPFPGERANGSHAFPLVGYVDDDDAPGGGYFILRNSWSPWGFDGALHNGYGVLPYAFITEHNQVAITAERAPLADIYVRAHDADEGELPRGSDRYNSPDIWVRNRRDAQTAHQMPRAHDLNWIYVRTWNRGPEVAREVKADIFIAPATPSLIPDSWQALGTVTFPDIAAGESQTAALSWLPENAGPFAFLVRLHSPDDPVTYPWAVANDNNLALKNVVQLQISAGSSAELTLPLFTFAGENAAMGLEIDRKQFRRGRVQLSWTGAMQRSAAHLLDDEAEWLRLTSQADSAPAVTLNISADANARPDDSATITLTQRHGRWLIGRMLVDIRIV
ncbi:MAG: hypothetical protein GXP37_08485 [Chloroflexi bacterium]|nr:hypothetical protein [Chloroflexota bacterium]